MRVLADGCFDPLHWGHVRYLQAAAQAGSPLIVNIAPDAAILAKRRTVFQTRTDRARTILALSMVDRVCCHESLATAILAEKPRVLVKGADWRGRLPESVLAACQQVGAEIIYTPTLEKSSTERLSA